MSPTTLIVVRAMSRIRSTPMIIAIVRGSTFTAASTPINNGSDPPGTPAAPTAVITLRTMTTTCWGNVRGTPKTCARKSTVTPSRSEEHTSELQSHSDLVCRLLLEKKSQQFDQSRHLRNLDPGE